MKSHLEVGRVEYNAGSSNSNEANETYQVTFEKIFKGSPQVHCTVENSNKKAIAQNVSSTGFELIISDSGFGDTDLESTIYVHYYAVFIG